mmetsp:Transcript_116986/g.277885  ORF Transcript_116986/g.277885 Transcript_116986/m.277885 type:complete len:579 (-) Transcript_116986:123-1859(-)|eukprot:CAMPEP_0181503702 /NCGR_PEP_ID=MMETSP1110-20121109/57072_1 /TAXON_ID=174948 /ORGANISM="Symbiodinium sp., Strain CCMP421" /LENGTH=578 /DNA_ID=CAMNT_0023632451 /DNA_START=51 /DNA_END=1787 /DNA_ORIENTATION=+
MDEKAKAAEAKAKGNAAFAAKHFKEAIEHFTEAISYVPDHVFFSNRSACHASLEEYEKALEDGRRCVSLKPDWPKGYARQGLAEYFLKRYEDAEATYKKGLQLSPEDSSLKEGLQKVMDAKYDVGPMSGGDEAEDLLGKFDANSLTMAAARNPKVKEYMKDTLFMQRINALMGMTSSAGALKEQMVMQLIQQDPRILEALAAAQGLVVRTGADFAPEDVKAEAGPQPKEQTGPKEKTPEDTRTPEQKQADDLKAEGNRLYKKRKFSEAMEQYDKALEKAPDDLTYYNNKCAVWMEMGEENYPKVLKTCEDLISKRYEINSRNPGGASFEKVAKVYTRMASVYEKQKRFDEAIAMYNKALTEDNNRLTRNLLREAERAKEKYEKDKYLDSAKAEEHREKGNALFKANNMVAAKQEYDEAIRRNPKDARLYSNRAATFTKLLAYPDALRDLDDCLKLEPTFVKAYSRKGAAHFFLKEYHKALEAYEAGLKLEKDNEECQRGREQVIAKIMETQSDAVDEEQVRHAMADPEIQKMLHDPQVRMFLKTLQESPAEGEKAMRSDPKLAEIVSKLMAAGIIRTK